DFLSTDYGKAVLTNSSIQMLLKQSTAGVDLVSKTFYLTEGEKELLLSADIGEGLFFAGQNHVAAKVLAAPFEHELITSNPQELLKKQQEKERDAQAEAATSGQTAVPMSQTSTQTQTPASPTTPTPPQGQ